MHPSNNYHEYKKNLIKFKRISIIKEDDIGKVLSQAKLVICNEGMPLYLSHFLGIKNLNITNNKPPQIPKQLCNEILNIK